MCHHLICSERKHQLWTFVSDRKVNQLAEVLAEHVYAQNVLLQSLCFVHTSIATVKSSTQREKWILSSQLPNCCTAWTSVYIFTYNTFELGLISSFMSISHSD